MNTKTMEGLVGAGTNMNLLETPFRVYKDAERRGDTGVMDRAMGYMNKCSEKAEEYKEKADRGMKEDAEAARERFKAEQEKAIQKRREERKKLEEQIEEGRKDNKADTVYVSGEGTMLLKENAAADNKVSENLDSAEASLAKAKTDIDKEAVIYTKTGEAGKTEQTLNISISI